MFQKTDDISTYAKLTYTFINKKKEKHNRGTETKRKKKIFFVLVFNIQGGRILLEQNKGCFVFFSSTSIQVPEYRDAPTRCYQLREIATKIKWFKSGANRIKVKEPTNVGMKQFLLFYIFRFRFLVFTVPRNRSQGLLIAVFLYEIKNFKVPSAGRSVNRGPNNWYQSLFFGTV